MWRDLEEGILAEFAVLSVYSKRDGLSVRRRQTKSKAALRRKFGSCTRCGKAPEQGLSTCRACLDRPRDKAREAETRKAWLAANRERVAEKQREWSEANRESRAEYFRRYAAANRERRAESSRRYRKRISAKHLAQQPIHEVSEAAE